MRGADSIRAPATATLMPSRTSRRALAIASSLIPSAVIETIFSQSRLVTFIIVSGGWTGCAH